MEDYFDKAQGIAVDLATKTEGLAHLMYYYDKHSSGPRDKDAMVGVALILEDLAKAARDLSDMLDCVRIEKVKAQREAV